MSVYEGTADFVFRPRLGPLLTPNSDIGSEKCIAA
jgi:hypothetical protein